MSQYSLADLCDLADVTPRTVRYYITQGLLRPPAGAGPAARYDDGHLYRLRLIRRLQRDHLPLGEIRNRLSALSDPQVERLASEPAPVADSAAEYIARVLGARGAGAPGGAPPPPAAVRPPGPAGSMPSAPDAALASPASAPAVRLTANDPDVPGGPDGTPTPVTTSDEPVRSQWERIVLTPDIELHVRRPLGRIQNRRVDRLLETARAILKEATE